jgi:hypothetical protein
VNVRVCYVSFAISLPWAEGPRVWRRHHNNVLDVAATIAAEGYAVIVPILLDLLPHRTAMLLDHELVRRADVLYVHQSRWTALSSGIGRECTWARELGLPVVTSIDELRKAGVAA